MNEALVDNHVGNMPQLFQHSAHDRVRDITAIGVIGIDQDDRVGPFATNQVEVSTGVESEVVFLAQDVVDDLGSGPGELVIGRKCRQIDQDFFPREPVQDRLDDFDRPVADEDRIGVKLEHPAQLGRDHPVLRRIEFQQCTEFPGPDDFALEVHHEQLGRIRVGQKAGIDLEPQLGNALGERPRAGRVRAGLLLEALDSLDQSGLTRALADPRQRFPSLLLQPPCRHSQIKWPELQSRGHADAEQSRQPRQVGTTALEGSIGMF